jgi:hypothetical protein
MVCAVGYGSRAFAPCQYCHPDFRQSSERVTIYHASFSGQVFKLQERYVLFGNMFVAIIPLNRMSFLFVQVYVHSSAATNTDMGQV